MKKEVWGDDEGSLVIGRRKGVLEILSEFINIFLAQAGARVSLKIVIQRFVFVGANNVDVFKEIVVIKFVLGLLVHHNLYILLKNVFIKNLYCGEVYLIFQIQQPGYVTKKVVKMYNYLEHRRCMGVNNVVQMNIIVDA